MNIQVINYSEEKQAENVYYSKLQSPRSLDEFDINVIDLSDEKIWVYVGQNTESINGANDFKSIQKMVENRATSLILYVLPQNCSFKYNRYTTSRGQIEYNHTTKMKDTLPSLRSIIHRYLIPEGYSFPELVFENTKTIIGETAYDAAFFFRRINNPNLNNTVTQSNKSGKSTTIRINNMLYITTLNVTGSFDMLKYYLKAIFEPKKEEPVPDWMDQLSFFDDEDQKSIIQENKIIICQANCKINQANEKLQENAVYKSILFTNGNELVEVVFKILEKILNYDLSKFVDEKKEDFLIKKEDYTLIGEIKGITSNVKNENISQLENHYQQYMDQLQERGEEENVHQVLIINPLRSKPLSEREPVYEHQIKLATRNGSLIIETKTLLKLFETFLQGKLSVEDCEKLFISKTGLLEEKDFLFIC